MKITIFAIVNYILFAVVGFGLGIAYMDMTLTIPATDGKACFSDEELDKHNKGWYDLGVTHATLDCSTDQLTLHDCINNFELVPSAERYCPPVNCPVCYNVEYRECEECIQCDEFTETCPPEELDAAYEFGYSDGYAKCVQEQKMYQ